MSAIDFEQLLKQVIGLDSASIGGATIERGVRLRMSSVGLEKREEYWLCVRSSKSELQELVEAVVVPETWFFRDPEAFVAMGRLLTEAWRPSPSSPALRVLSMPCSTGEEPYSIVMSLLDAGFSPEQFHVEAIDISARALSRAKSGYYGGNSFRGQNLGFRERYFRPAADGYALAGSLKDRVQFRQANLLSDDLLRGDRPYDVVFCRNVLIYFDRQTQVDAMRRLASLLTPHGLLFVGPAEAFLASCNGFAAVNQALCFAFRKSAVNSPKLVKPPLRTAPSVRPPQTRPRSTAIQPQNVPLVAQPSPARPPADLRTARNLADAGRLIEAVEHCDRHLREHGDSAEVYYLLGLANDAMGSSSAAAEFYKKALYLEPNHVEALTHLALLKETEGDLAAADRLRDRARRADRIARPEDGRAGQGRRF